MLTMLLGGLWHGAAWHFVLWGGLHGGGLAAERWWQEKTGRKQPRFPWLRWLLTFNLVCLAWVFFRAPGLDTVGELTHQVIAGGGTTVLTAPLILLIGVGFSLHFLPRRPALEARALFARLGPLGQGVVLAGVLLVTGVMVTGPGVAPFIYFRF
jgi:hypothetical protein